MDQVLYDLMDWAGIEEIVYSEAANPERLLGAHEVEEGLLIQVFMAARGSCGSEGWKESYPWSCRTRPDIMRCSCMGRR